MSGTEDDISQTNRHLVKRKNSLILMENLTTKLLDSKLMERYGTSLSVNMGAEYHKVLSQKYEQMKAEFDKINTNKDNYIDKQELLTFLNNFQKEVFIVSLNNHIRIKKLSIVNLLISFFLL